MNIWILNHYAGTASSPSTRHFDVACELARRGHNVTIFAAGFHYQKLVEERLAAGESFRLEEHEGVRFVWLRTFPYRANNWRRVVNMLSFAVRAIRVGRRLHDRPDVIIGSSVHPLAAVAGYVLARLRRTRFIFEVRDLWPETLIDMGALRRRGIAANVLRAVEKSLYVRAEKIITLLPLAHEYITALGIPREKIHWIPNGADLRRYADITEYHGGNRGTFTLMYLGAHGRANALDVVLDAVAILEGRGIDGFRFVLVGEGAEKENLRRYADSKGLKTVEFRSGVPKDRLFSVMNEADAFLFNLEDLPLFRFGISSNKLFDYLASGRPIVFSGNTANNPVRDAGAGFSVPARSPDQLADAILQLITLTPQERAAMGRNGLAYVRERHDIRVLASSFEKVMQP